LALKSQMPKCSEEAELTDGAASLSPIALTEHEDNVLEAP
jgi:hypothetical protein